AGGRRDPYRTAVRERLWISLQRSQLATLRLYGQRLCAGRARSGRDRRDGERDVHGGGQQHELLPPLSDGRGRRAAIGGGEENRRLEISAGERAVRPFSAAAA